MGLHSDHYFQLMNEHLGGVNSASLTRFFYWNNPLALKHWTMNVIELLLLFGAAAALVHAIHAQRKKSNPAYLCLWFASVVYLLVCEVPLYFPQLIGADPVLVFTHNEFTAGMLYNMTPFYIVALYPALLYPSYLLAEQGGLFKQRHGLITGAVCVGVIHSCFYELFDHFGPQYGWWVWNYDHPFVHLRLASVPLTSVVVFSLTPPMVATLLMRFFLLEYVRKRRAQRRHLSVISLCGRTLLVGLLIPLLNSALPTAWITSLQFDEQVVRTSYTLVIAITFAFALFRFHQATPSTSPFAYPVWYFVLYLMTFMALWLYALPEYVAANDGLTGRGTPTGSLAYVIFCFICGVFFVSKSLLQYNQPGKSSHLSATGVSR